MGMVTIPPEAYLQSPRCTAEQARTWCQQLEEGNILFFPQTPIALPEDDLRFLLTLEQTSSGLHKNLAYKPKRDEISGADMKNADPAASERLHRILREYSRRVTEFLESFLSPYRSQ